MILDKDKISYYHSMGAMFIPMELTKRQLIIYHQLYLNCNFQDMTVEYSLDQLVSDIKIFKTSRKIISSEIKKLIELGYLEIIEKGTRAKATIYKIIIKEGAEVI